MTVVEVLFGLLGAVAVAAALLVVTTKQLVHAALWLVVALGAVAGCYLLLSAEFVAWVQVLIYVGAVVVLLLFGLMLTRAPIGVSADLDGPPLQGEHIDVGDGGRGSSASAGTALFRAWVLPFEVLSVLLLAALVGAIVLSRRDIGPADGEGDPAGGR